MESGTGFDIREGSHKGVVQVTKTQPGAKCWAENPKIPKNGILGDFLFANLPKLFGAKRWKIILTILGLEVWAGGVPSNLYTLPFLEQLSGRWGWEIAGG